MEDIENIDEIPEGDPNDRRVDLDTPLESFCLGAAIGSGLASVPVLFTGDMLLFINAAMICFIASMVRWSVDCTYFINGEKRQIDYSRSIFGVESRDIVCRYEDVHAVAVDSGKRYAKRRRGQHGPIGHTTRTGHWVYWVVLVLNDGRVLQVSDKHQDDVGKANRRAKWLSEEVGSLLVEGRAEETLEISFSGGNVTIKHTTPFFGFGYLIDHIPFFVGFIIAGAAVLLFGAYNQGMLEGLL